MSLTMQAVALVLLASTGFGAALRAHHPSPHRGAEQPFVAGGVVRENGDLKFIVEIVESSDAASDDIHKGSGALVSFRFVLTTSYAVTTGPKARTMVVIGRSKGDTWGTFLDVDEKLKEPNEGILTLLKLSNGLLFDDLNRAINLPSPDSEIPAGGVMAILSGWGPTAFDKENNQLIATPVHVLSGSACGTEGRLCSSNPNIGACEGDDGGPLVQDMKNGVFRLLGIATATKGVKCPPEKATVYVDVAKHTQWIYDTMYTA